MPAGVRRVFDVDWMGYGNWTAANGGATFDNTPTYPWYTDNATDAWYCNGSGANRYIYINAAPGSDTYLIRSGQTTDLSTVNVEWGVDAVGSTDNGVYIMAESSTLDQSSYRIYQDYSANKIMVDKMTALGSAENIGSVSYTPTGTGSVDYYRVRYFPTDYVIQTSETVASTAGKFIIYASDDYELLVNRGNVTDGSPLSIGSYNGLYVGAGGTPKFYMYTRGNDYYPLLKRVKCKHTLKGPSTLWMYVPKPYYNQWSSWSKGDYCQAFIYDEDGSNAYEVLDFYGIVNTIRQHGTDNIEIISQSPLQLANQNQRSMSSYTGVSTGYIDFFPSPGGEEAFTEAEWLAASDYPVWVNNLDFKAGAVTYTNKADEGKNDLEICKHLCLVEDYYMFYTPRQRFLMTNLWNDRTSNINMDCSAMTSRFHAFDYIEDVNQMSNESVVYRSGGTRSTSPTPNTTTQGIYGIRLGMAGEKTDLHIADATEANAVSQTIVNRHSTDTYNLNLYFLARFGQVFPGDLVQGSIPMMDIGGDYLTPVGSWTPATISILEKEWDTESFLIRFNVNATWSDSGNVKGYQHYEDYVGDIITNEYGKNRLSQANHV